MLIKRQGCRGSGDTLAGESRLLEDVVTVDWGTVGQG